MVGMFPHYIVKGLIFVKAKLLKYFFTSVIIAGAFWFYFQVDTYPYKVARWFQPAEATLVSHVAKHCSPTGVWLNNFVEHAITYQGAYSAQVAFLSAEKKLDTCEVGYKDKLLGIQVNSTHRYRYASVTKLITTAAVLNLVTQGKLHLEDTLVSFLPELTQFKDERIRSITIANLLNHNAGFNRLALSGDPMFLRRNKPWCPKNMHQLQSLSLTFSPGEKQIYSNLGYCLLGEVIGRVTGEPYRAYVEREYSLAARNIKFVNDHYYTDEVRYDYRYEEWYDDSYLNLFDFKAISAVAGLSGSASDLAQLLWDIHHSKTGSPFVRKPTAERCYQPGTLDCIELGVFYYQPEKNGLALQFHQGYLPGAASIAVIDSFGGVTVLLKSGANRYQADPQNEWVRWIYNQLTTYYRLQGKLPVLNTIN
jgi:D-alanyl-D-alanine carboxypeptidase